MTVLGIETATTVCAAAVVRDGVLVAEASVDEPHAHAERIMGFVERTVASAGGLPALDAVAVSIGPGSFTGLRIGLSVAKGLAFAADLKVVPVPTLEAIAWRLLQAGKAAPGDRILAVLPARRGEAFASWFSVFHAPTGHQIQISDIPEGDPERALLASRRVRYQISEISAVQVHLVSALAAEAADSGALVTGDTELLSRALPPGRSLRTADRALAAASAAAVAFLGLALLQSGATADPETLEPAYALDFIALTKDRSGK